MESFSCNNKIARYYTLKTEGLGSKLAQHFCTFLPSVNLTVLYSPITSQTKILHSTPGESPGLDRLAGNLEQ